MPDMLGINVFVFFWQTQLLSKAKAVENVKRRYKQMYINFPCADRTMRETRHQEIR
jgi:hypothetical protein